MADIVVRFAVLSGDLLIIVGSLVAPFGWHRSSQSQISRNFARFDVVAPIAYAAISVEEGIGRDRWIDAAIFVAVAILFFIRAQGRKSGQER